MCNNTKAGSPRTRSNSINYSLSESLHGKDLNITIEISPDEDYYSRVKSTEWFIRELKKSYVNLNVNYKMLHTNKGEFYIYVQREHERKIIFSSSQSYLDTVTGSLINKKNYCLIMNNLINFLNTDNRKHYRSDN